LDAASVTQQGEAIMGFSDVLWIFIMLASLQPVIKQRMLAAARTKAISKIEKRHGSRVILLVHRQESMALLGFPLVRYIDIQDSEQVLRAIRLTDPKVPIQLVLHTPGGLVLASVQIARAIKRHEGKATVYVPHYAMSGGTLIAMAADEIVMSADAVLGPVDPQVGTYAAASVVKAVEEKPVAEVDDVTLILADQSRKALNQVRETVEELLTEQVGDAKAKELAKVLSEGTWTHDFAITYEAAKRLGLNVSDQMPNEVLELMDLYPQPVQKQPSVTYLPSRRRATEVDSR
jgi:ClpP class serine protease